MQPKIFNINYNESCFECDSVYLDIRNIHEDKENEGIVHFEVVCRECGETWLDWEEVQSS